MKLPMAKNSLFAILLRSPWWISFLVMAVLTLLAMSFLPKEYSFYGIAAGFPFGIIGSIALYQQWNKPTAARAKELTERLGAMSWREFSDIVEATFKMRGYDVVRLPAGKNKADSGADFEVHNGSQLSLVSCKRWKAASHGVEPLKELQQLSEQREAFERIYLSIQVPSEQALRYAQQERIKLIHHSALIELLAPAMRQK